MGSLRRSVSNLPPALIGGACILLPLIFVAAFPGLLAPYSPDTIVGIPLSGPSAANLLGTDEIGRDILSRVIYGARSDVVVSLAAATIAFVVGSLIGVLLGYRGGIAETTGMRVVDIFLAFPAIVLSLFLITIFGHGEMLEIFAIAVVMTPSMARFARGTSVVLRNRAYIDASRILRARDRYVVRRHLFPNALRTLLVAGSVLGAGAVLIAASLSYLGLGPPPPTPSWGSLLYSAFQNVFEAPLYGIVPGLCITLLAYGYLLLGKGLGQLQGRTGGQEAVFKTSVVRI
jgi:peptide/nickel transport system permease protein